MKGMMTMNKRYVWVALAATLALVIAGVAATVNIHGNIIDADSGYQIAGTAPVGHTLVGNGTEYVDSAPTSNACTSYASSSSEGCALLPNGDWLLWATGASEAANFSGSVTIDFPVTFPTACYAVTGVAVNTPSAPTGNAQAYAGYVESCSAGSASVYYDVGADNVGTVAHSVTVTAIGH